MERSPLDKSNSPWIALPDMPAMPGCHIFQRFVSDGMLAAIVAQELDVGWHMSISFRDKVNRHTRYPSWDELANARDELLPEHLTFIMYFPPPAEYVNLHPTTFHLYQH